MEVDEVMSFFLVSFAAAIAVGLLRSLVLFGSRSRAAAHPVGARVEPRRLASRRDLAIDEAA